MIGSGTVGSGTSMVVIALVEATASGAAATTGSRGVRMGDLSGLDLPDIIFVNPISHRSLKALTCMQPDNNVDHQEDCSLLSKGLSE